MPIDRDYGIARAARTTWVLPCSIIACTVCLLSILMLHKRTPTASRPIPVVATQPATKEIDWIAFAQSIPEGPVVVTLQTATVQSDNRQPSTVVDQVAPYVTIDGFDPADSRRSACIQAIRREDRLCVTTTVAGQGLAPVEGLRLVLFGRDARVRHSLIWHRSQAAQVYILSEDSRQDMPSDAWVVSAEHVSDSLTVTFSIRLTQIEPATDQGSSVLHAVLCSLNGAAEEGMPEDPPLYWLLDSARGAAFDLLLLPEFRSKWPSFRAENCVVSNGIALAWDLHAFSMAPGTERNIPVWISGNQPELVTWQLQAALSAEATSSNAVWQMEGQVHGAIPLTMIPLAVKVPSAANESTYTLRLAVRDGASTVIAGQVPLLVISDPQTSSRRYLIGRRQQIEADKKPSSFVRSMVSSHVARCLISLGLPSVTRDGLSDLRQLGLALTCLKTGEPPALAPGLYQIEFCQATGEPTNCKLSVPKHYDPKLPWPVLLDSDNTWNMPHMVRLILDPKPDASLAAVATLVKAGYVDASRAYLAATCFQAYPAAETLTRHPDLWAAAAFVLRMKWSPLWANVHHVPIRCYNTATERGDVLVSRTAECWMLEQGCQVGYFEVPGLAHWTIPACYDRLIASWMLRHRKVTHPAEVLLATEGYACNQAYWVSVDAIEDEALLARIHAKLEGSTVHVATHNVTGYTLDLAQAPTPTDATEIRIIENNRLVGTLSRSTSPFVFSQSAPGAEPMGRNKTARCCGPIKQAFARPLMIVHERPQAGANADDTASQATELLANSVPGIRMKGSCWDDQTNWRQLANEDVVLIGSLKTCRLMEPVFKNAPVRQTDDRLLSPERGIDLPQAGLVLLQPNPFNPDRYVLIIGSTGQQLLKPLARAFVRDHRLLGDYDLVIGYCPAQTDDIVWRLGERLSQHWGWSDLGPALATIRTAHADWQWEQLACQWACQEAGADILVHDGLLRLPLAGQTGTITARTITSRLRNDWLVTMIIAADRFREALQQLRMQNDRVVAATLATDAAEPSSVQIDRFVHTGGLLRILVPYDLSEWFLAAQEVQLSNLFLADCFVRRLTGQPEQDLDGLLSSQQQPQRAAPMQIMADDLLKETKSP